MAASGFAEHDHTACMDRALARLHRHCREHGLRATPLRRRVLAILLESHRALGAYDILERLRDEGLGSQPPVAYRALDFLQSQGFVHRIERLNAFIACARHEGPHNPAFLICRSCRTVAETDMTPARAQLMAAAARHGFAIEHSSAEAIGLCPACAHPEESEC